MLDMKKIYETVYNEHKGYGQVNHAGCIQEFIAKTLKPSNVLDVGCGDGAFCRYLGSHNITALGLDIAINGGDIRAIEFADEFFEWSTAFDVLEHIPEDELDLALSELMRVSQKGMILSICYRDSIYNVNGRSLHETVKPHEWWRELLSKYGEVEDWRINPTWGYYIVRS